MNQPMKPTQALHDRGQSVWLDNITRDMLDDGTLQRYRDELSVTGLTSNPTIFAEAIGRGTAYDAQIDTLAPVNVTLLFSTRQYLADAETYMRALERRLAAGLRADVISVASLSISRWDTAVAGRVPASMQNKLGVAIAQLSYKAYWELVSGPRWRALEGAGARPQRLLWASTGSKTPCAPADLYVGKLAASNTIDTMPEKTLLAFADTATVSMSTLFDDSDAASVLKEFESHDIDRDALGLHLQQEGGESFVKSWRSLLATIEHKRTQLSHRAAARVGRHAEGALDDRP